MTAKGMLIRQLHKTGMTLAEAEFCVNQMLNFFSDSLTRGEKIVLPGFGTFLIKPQEARLSGIMLAPKHNRIVFCASRKLRNAVNGKQKK